jgi:hypothetical protein
VDVCEETSHFEKYCPLNYGVCVQIIRLRGKVDEIISLYDNPVADSRLRLQLMKFSKLKGADWYQLQHMDVELTAIESSSLMSSDSKWEYLFNSSPDKVYYLQ